MLQCRSTSLRRKDTIDKYRCFVSRMKCHNKVMMRLDSLLALIPLQAGCCWKQPHLDLLFQKGGHITLIGSLISSFTSLESV
jgi:hypothetical protein